MSRIAFFNIPAQGHTNPTLEVVKALVSRGHEVRYYSYDALKERIIDAGATYVSCDAYDYQLQISPQDANRIGKDLPFSMELIVKMTLALDDALLAQMRAWNPDVIIADSMAFWGKLIAKKIDVPFISSTTTFAFNRYSSKIMKQGFLDTLGSLIGMIKSQKFIKMLQEKGYPVKNALDIIANQDDTHTIVYTSKKFQPRAETFSKEYYSFIGPSIRPSRQQIKQSPGKEIYISMGTVKNQNVEFFKNCIAAFKDSDVHVTLSVGDVIDLHELGDIPANFTVQRRVDQIAVLQQVDMFLTHCGMNSVNEALYYAVPLIMYPQTPEQGGVATRVRQLEAGIYLEGDEPEDIIDAVMRVYENPTIKKNAEKISKGFMRCGGAQQAADKIESVIKMRS